MLVSHRVLDAPELDAYIHQHSLRHSNYWVHCSRRRNAASTTGLWPALNERPWGEEPELLVVLDGRHDLRGREIDTSLFPGSVAVVHGREMDLHRALRSSTLFFGGAACMWTRPLPKEDGCLLRLSPAGLQRLRQAAAELARQPGDPLQYAVAVREILRLLRAEGVPLEVPDAEALVEPVPPKWQALMRALDACFRGLRSGPAAVDLERMLRSNRRRIHELLVDYQRSFGVTKPLGWREIRQIWRLGVGPELLSGPGATVASVASLLGYGSHEALHRAFSNAGMPTPSEMRRRILRGFD